MSSNQAILNSIGQEALQAQTLLARALSSRLFSDVEQAVAAWHHLASITDSAYPYREAILSTFAVALLLRWETYHDLSDLDLAIEHAGRALRMCHDGLSRDRYQNLTNLGGAYLDRAKSANEGPERAIEDAKFAYSYLEKAHYIYLQRGRDLDLVSRTVGRCVGQQVILTEQFLSDGKLRSHLHAYTSTFTKIAYLEAKAWSASST
jgi:tetratricopeptide (TPR) repeat protein